MARQAITVTQALPSLPKVQPMRLTDKSVAAAKPAARRQEIPDSIVVGLYCVIQPTGQKGWCVRYRYRGRPTKLTLEGRYPEIDLKMARELARKALGRKAEGHDPAREKVLARAAKVDSIESVAQEFLERHVRHNRPRSAKETERLLRLHVLPRWRGRLVYEISRRDVLDMLDCVVDGGAPIGANRVFAVVRKLFNWCISRDILAVSPCSGIRPPSPERSRDRVLSDDELRDVLVAADKMGGTFGQLVTLLTLTGQRRDEVARARWEEIDIANRLWTLPAERVKNNRPHQVPLSDAVIAVLSALPRGDSPYVLTTYGAAPATGYSKGKKKLDSLLPADMPPWRLHDLRRTVASGMARLGVNLPVIEKCLNHVSGSFAGIVGVYQHHSFAAEKAQALQAWGRHVDSLLHPATGTVVNLRRHK
jgi:integrase